MGLAGDVLGAVRLIPHRPASGYSRRRFCLVHRLSYNKVPTFPLLLAPSASRLKRVRRDNSNFVNCIRYAPDGTKFILTTRFECYPVKMVRLGAYMLLALTANKVTNSILGYIKSPSSGASSAIVGTILLTLLRQIEAHLTILNVGLPTNTVDPVMVSVWSKKPAFTLLSNEEALEVVEVEEPTQMALELDGELS